MNSIKNTFVAVLLLGASYGVYQAITTPDPTIQTHADLFEEVAIEPGSPSTELDESGFPSVPDAPTHGETLPPRTPTPSIRKSFPKRPPELSNIPNNQFAPPNSTPNASPKKFSPDSSVRQATRWRLSKQSRTDCGHSRGGPTS